MNNVSLVIFVNTFSKPMAYLEALGRLKLNPGTFHFLKKYTNFKSFKDAVLLSKSGNWLIITEGDSFYLHNAIYPLHNLGGIFGEYQLWYYSALDIDYEFAYFDKGQLKRRLLVDFQDKKILHDEGEPLHFENNFKLFDYSDFNLRILMEECGIDEYEVKKNMKTYYF